MFMDKYIKTKKRLNSIGFYNNKMPKENECCTFFYNIIRFYYECWWKTLSTNIFRRIQIPTEK